MKIEMESLIKNIEKSPIPYTLDIVLEPGSFNGAYEIGGLMFLQEMEKHKFFTVGRISGSSIGAFAAFLYFTDNLHKYIEIYEYLCKSFLENITIEKLKDVMLEMVNSIDDDLFKTLQHNKLYITTYDVQKMQQIIKSDYKTREDIVDAVLKSCHLPLLINGHIFFKSNGEYFFDGGMPYIFRMRENDPKYRIIYLSVTTLGKLKKILNIKGEKTAYGRILEGILDVYTFFHEKKETIMTSFVHEWNWQHFLRLRLAHFIMLYITYNMILIHKLVTFLYPKIKNTTLFKHFAPFIRNIYNDIVLYLIFK